MEKVAPTRKHRALGLLAFNAALFIVGLGLFELVVRLFFPQPASWLAIYRRHPTEAYHVAQPNLRHSLDTGETRWSIVTDGDGFRVGDPAVAQGDLPLGVWLGDSFAFGHGVDEELSWIGLMNRDPDRRFHFINTGVPSAGPFHYWRNLAHLLEVERRPIRLAMIAVFLGNDFYDCEPGSDSRDQTIIDGILGGQAERDLKFWVKVNVHSYRLFVKAYHRMFQKPKAYDDHDLYAKGEWTGELGEAAKNFKTYFEELAALAAKHDVPVRVMLIPGRRTVEFLQGKLPADPTLDFEIPRRRAIEAISAVGLPYVDLTDMLVEHPTTETYYRFDGHFTPKGHTLVYERLKSGFGILTKTGIVAP